MKALVLKEGGSIDGFKVAERPIPDIKEDELLINVKAVGLNPSDYQTAEYLPPECPEMVLGLDVAGVVAKAGSEVTDFKEGDRVFYLRSIFNPNGGFAEYAVTPARFACKIPDSIEFENAAALPGAGFTAYHIMFDRFHLKTGNTIFIQGGAGGLGSYAIQIAKHSGLKVITTCLGRDIEYVRSLGADIAIDFQHEDVYKILSDETGGLGPHYIISSIGPQGATRDLDALRFGGELAVTAGLPDFNGWQFYKKGITVHEIAFGEFLTNTDPAANRKPVEIGTSLSAMAAAHDIGFPRITITDLEGIPDSLRNIKAGNVTGKVIARI